MQLADVCAKARELLQGDAGRRCELHGDAAAIRCCRQVGSALHGDGVLHLHLLVGLSGHAPAVLGRLCRAASAARMSRTDD
eukprot:scaffold73863_cov75-Phaeocystis_antarctica.AAC.1